MIAFITEHWLAFSFLLTNLRYVRKSYLLSKKPLSSGKFFDAFIAIGSYLIPLPVMIISLPDASFWSVMIISNICMFIASEMSYYYRNRRKACLITKLPIY